MPATCVASTLPLFNFAQTLPQENPYNSYDVTERTISAYGELTFSGTRWNANAGVRVVHTETTAATAEAAPTSLWTPSTVGSTQTWNVQYASTQPSDTKGQYTIPLPSANFNYWAVPDRLQLRVAAAQTMSRVDLNELAPTSYNNAINGQPQLYYTGTAGLKPIRANQLDLSAEWYYHPHSALTLALFGKKIHDDIYTGTQTNVNLGTVQCVGGPPGKVPCTPFPWTVYAPANGATSDFYGIEIAWQHILDNGFGAHAQYTHTWTRTFDQDGNEIPPINQEPPMTLSAGLFYDKGRFSADVNWDYAASYQSYCSTVHGGPGLARDLESVPMAHGQRALDRLPGTPGVRRRQESHRLGGPLVPQRQPLIAVGEWTKRRSEHERRGLWVQRLWQNLYHRSVL